MISKEYVRAAYRLIHGREPEDEGVLSGHVVNYASIAELRQAFIGSDEFLVSRTIAGPLYAARPPQVYGSLRQEYEARGGGERFGDADIFLTHGGAGDHARHYFFAMAIDQIEKEGIAGDFAEFGVYRGATASILAARARRGGRAVYLFDTFEGFAAADLVGPDAGRGRGFSDTSEAAVRDLVGEERVHFVTGHFPDSTAQVPDGRMFSLVHIDCKLYAPYRRALEWFWPRLAPGGFLAMHDYRSVEWPGAELAIDEFFAGRAEAVVPVPDHTGTAVARKSRQQKDAGS